MTTKQKIWLGILVGLFVIPEILWGTMSNFIFGLLTPTVNGLTQVWRDSFIMSYEFEKLYKVILTVQFLGLFLFCIIWIKSKKDIHTTSIYWAVLVVNLLLLVPVALVIYLTLFFNPLS